MAGVLQESEFDVDAALIASASYPDMGGAELARVLEANYWVLLQLYDEAWKQPQVLKGDVAAAAEYVWTSGKALKGGLFALYIIRGFVCFI